MKKSVFFMLAAAVAILLSSCSGREKLAQNLAGSWASAPAQLNVGAESSATLMKTYQFTKDEDHPGGNVYINGLISITSSLTSGQGILPPTTFSASGTAAASGTWTANDDDEITIYIDPTTISVVVDPATILLPNFEGSEDIMTYKNIVAQNVNERMKVLFTQNVVSIVDIDDIEFSKDKQTFKCEVNDRKYVLRRQSVEQNFNNL